MSLGIPASTVAARRCSVCGYTDELAFNRCPQCRGIQGVAPEIKALVDESTKRFEAKWAAVGMLLVARASGWIEDYRKEGLALARAAAQLGWDRQQNHASSETTPEATKA